MKKGILITVRTASTRLPKKCLLKFLGKYAVEYVIERAKRTSANTIVLCTTYMEEDRVLCEIAEKHNIKFYRGSIEDKLERWYGAVKKYDIDFFVTFDADDVLCEPILADLAFEQAQKNNSNFIEAPELVVGSFTYGISRKALEKVCEIKNTLDTEMIFSYFKDTGLFKIEQLEGIPDIFKRNDIRMTMDYREDYEFFKNIIEHFNNVKKDDFNLFNIISYLNKHPEVIKINQFRAVEWKKNQIEKTKLILK